jgi:murein DD-endopeptidase MepM/ murein hydrolase activator NlpD
MSSSADIFYSGNDFFSNLDGELVAEDARDWLEAGLAPVYPGSKTSLPSPFLLVIPVIVLLVLLALSNKLTINESKSAVPPIQNPPAEEGKAKPPALPGDALAIAAPYTDYSITQGPHGVSYGHYAIDIAAGRGTPIMSPINGTVTQVHVDEFGNPTLVIENEVYSVTMLHGDYSVAIGEAITIGQQVGTESNKGYTMDMAGNLCYGRSWCGNHTHLNVYDKRIQSNVNPLDLIRGG